MKIANIAIPVYMIGHPMDNNSLKNVLKQFEGRDEFHLNIIALKQYLQGSLNYWQTIKKCVEKAIDEQEDCFILCEFDHVFTPHYNKNFLIRNIIEAHNQGCNILCGGIGSFHDAVPLTRNRFWIDNFLTSSFTVIYRKFYQQILTEIGTDKLTSDQILSKITSQKMVLYPFIAVRHYSNITELDPLKCEIMIRFSESETKLKTYQKVYDRFLCR